MKHMLISALDAVLQAKQEILDDGAPLPDLDEAASELRAAIRSCDAEEARP